jgi:hypothetical protein
MPKGSEITPSPLAGGQQVVARDNIGGGPLLVTTDQVVVGAPWAGAGVADAVLKAFVFEAVRSLQVTAWDTASAPRLPSTGTVTWPFDASAGAYTTLSIDSAWRAVDQFQVTHAGAGKVVTVTLVFDATNGDASITSIVVV